MTRTRRTLLLLLAGALAAALIAAGSYWFFANFHQVPFEFRAPPGPEARHNRLLALERTLRTRGHVVFNWRRFNTTDFSDAAASAVLLDLDPRSLRDEEVDALLDFVARGALLLMRMPESAEGRAGTLLDQLDIEPLEPNDHCFEVALGAGRKQEMCGGTRIGGDVEVRYTRLASYHDKDYGYWFGEVAHEQGRVFVVSDLDMLHNSALDDAEALELGGALLAPLLDRKRIHLFRGGDAEPFHVLLLRRGWPALLPALVALLLWLWQRSERFGPILPERATPRRALLEHVRASGEFLFRRGQPLAMHRALLARVQRRIEQREPEIAALGGQERDAALAARTGLAAAAIGQALNPVGLGHAETFHTTLSTLLQLERRL